MQRTFKDEGIEQILAEADELLRKVDPKFIESIEEEEKRIDLEQQAQSLKLLKTQVRDKIEKEGEEGALESRPYGKGMHEAIEAIVKAMRGLASYFSH